jgi:hypothetical protein
MEKVLAALSILLLMCQLNTFSIISPTVKAYETVTVRVVPENITVKLGQPFNVNVTFENMPCSEYNGALGFQFNLSWNNSVLQGISMQEVAFHIATPQTELWNIWSIENVVSNGFVLYAYTWEDTDRAIAYGYAPLKGNGSWASITFASMAPGETDLHFSEVVVGSMTYLIRGSEVDGKVFVANILAGDLNQDGTVDAADVGTLTVAFGSLLHDPNWNANADINNDGTVNILDAIILGDHFLQHYP